MAKGKKIVKSDLINKVKDEALLLESGDNVDAQYGRDHDERINDHKSRRKSERHRCKGPQCEGAYKRE